MIGKSDVKEEYNQIELKMGILGGGWGGGVMRGSPGRYRRDDQGQLMVSAMFSCTMNHLACVSDVAL